VATKDRERSWGALAPIAVATCVATAGVLQLPIVDDEANAIVLARQGAGAVIEAGLGSQGHFHPPLNDLLQSAWLACVGTRPLWLVRLPAAVWWLSLCALLPWCLAPLLDSRQRARAQWAVVLWPTHWALPFLATWYSLGAFLTVSATGAFLHALSGEPRSPRTWSCLGLWAASVVALGYTVFAWPALLLGHLWIALRAGQRAKLHARALAVGTLGIGLALAPTWWTMTQRMAHAVRGDAGGGGWTPVGALPALLAGSTLPADPVLVIGACCVALAGAYALLRASERPVRTLFGAGSVVFVVLLVTRTLADKRLLLCSVLMASALGAAASLRRRREATLCVAVAALPASFGRIWPERTALLFPRWNDPHPFLAAIHCAAPTPRLMLADHPALRLTVDMGCGGEEAEAPYEQDPARLLERFERAHERAFRDRALTLDLVAFLESPPDDWISSSLDALRNQGFHLVEDRGFGADDWARFRGGDARPSVRYRWVRLVRPPNRP
jgi:hypothetical protein